MEENKEVEEESLGGGRAENIDFCAITGVDEGISAVKIPPFSSSSRFSASTWLALSRE